MFWDKVIYERFIHLTFSHICQLSPDYVPLEVIATGDHMKCTDARNKLTDSSGFEHYWK